MTITTIVGGPYQWQEAGILTVGTSLKLKSLLKFEFDHSLREFRLDKIEFVYLN